jgi:hypothetical protein
MIPFIEKTDYVDWIEFHKEISINTSYYNCLKYNFYKGFNYMYKNNIKFNIVDELIVYYVSEFVFKYNGKKDKLVETLLSFYDVDKEELKEQIEYNQQIDCKLIFDYDKYEKFCKLYKIK